ncbi:dihydroxyacetone phosphate acyltransferase-like [Clavelina lepadiformis]|uniref:dihydroxyacetone phosphate acyltransferase-like n=1 Tax=Clavelina lepadiformis TaxID=159417 RepID=UPI0040432B3D
MDLLYNPEKSSLNEDGCINMLEELQKHYFGAFKLATKTYSPPDYIHRIKRHPSDIWKRVMKSDRIQWMVQRIAREECAPVESIMKEVEKILKKLAFTDHLSLVRLLGFCLVKVQFAIYQNGVFINTSAVEKLRAMLKRHPVIFMPSHRSYMDFLMLSLVCFYFNIPLPAIAAGMDFQKMAVVSGMLRASGAFFMRRSFGSDRLYWAVFTEYVHEIIINGDRPMEFFIEGTRSRTGKSLNPKFGLLSVIAEPYLKAQTYDVLIVPVSISYERLLEEELYAYEMLGVPKPKESTSGLFKASSILVNNYGSVHMHFGDAISLRKYFGHLNRSVHATYPRYMLHLSEKEQNCMKELAYKIVREQQKNMICSPWTVIASVLCLYPDGISMHDLVQNVLWFKGVLDLMKVKISWSSDGIDEIIQKCLHQYRHIVESSICNDIDSSWINISSKVSERKSLYTETAYNSRKALTPRLRDEAVNYIILSSYRNQLLNYLVRPALVVFSLDHHLVSDSSNVVTFFMSSLVKDFEFLVHLLCKDFIFEPGKMSHDLETGLSDLTVNGSIASTADEVFVVRKHAGRLHSFLKSCFSPFMIAYWMACQFFLKNKGSYKMTTVIVQIQKWIGDHQKVSGITYEMLSINLLSNTVHSLIDMKGLTTHKLGKTKMVEVSSTTLQDISCKLAKFIPDLPELLTPKMQPPFDSSKL